MLCESRLWRLALCPDQDNTEPQDLSFLVPQDQVIRTGSQSSAAPLLSTPPSPDQLRRRGYSTLPREPQSLSLSVGDCIQPHPPQVPPYQALPPQKRPQPGRPISPGMEIPGQAFSPAPAPFLVPSSCQSICQNYSDLHIGGDQVLPIFTPDGALLPCSESRADRPFIHSCDVPPAGEEFLPETPFLREAPGVLKGGSSRWRAGSGRDRSFLLQGREGPFSNSLLNRYLEHELLDLYKQYMLESSARGGAPGPGDPVSPCLLLGSELVITSLDHITLQLSRVGNLEAGRAKDMVLSCLLRVASDFGESQISTPMLQISNDDRSSHTDSSAGPEVQTQPETQSGVTSVPEEERHADFSDPPAKDML
uniref:CXorf21 n=1 Tax=Osmerus mordax TaxID=8014 RepID=C1BK38_OSMMO|nr:CXorf21 [Osmerus mordax]